MSTATETKPVSTTINSTTTPPDEWQLDIAITDSPTVVPTDCGTGDGCGSTCASACAS
ncbi:FxLD family lanthipeptide [Actinacidiphila sp. ITFR-21]|uniref:FxLD family lanthipeptide n=1 Tax=Actinacidiphila sp. ITFR-21 TaxID=3075199 RepID=UPI002889F626|nr:FxLD family lanthipeptide [Streptomyces sp. ITFR-21]WNI17646.1 FxLD family lanthipeptide [Streptomyces sp. ITFR-21]WNI17786.1 FxLD family lanthipeptide [Streptomyces sp. ITFR-21]